MNTFSTIGAYHAESGTENQDVVLTGENKKYSAFVLADGVSSCKKGGIGAKIACEAILNLLLRNDVLVMNAPEKKLIDLTVEEALFHLRKTAEEQHVPVSEYASTLAWALQNKATKRTRYFSLGDSLVLGVKDGNCSIVEPPCSSSDGCYVTTTKGASTVAHGGFVSREAFDALLFLTDGAWKPLFERDRLKPEAQELLARNNADKLAAFYSGQNLFDDCSFFKVAFRRNRSGTETGESF